MSRSARFLQTTLAVLLASGAAALGGAGCQIDSSSPTALGLRDLDFNYFACKVQVPTASKCSMVACHGTADHAFRVYSPGKLRIAGQGTLAERDAPMTLGEAMANFASVRGISPTSDDLDQSLVLRKPLDPTQGGGEHKGGVIFHTTMDPDYLTLRAFLGGARQPAGCDLLTTLQMNP